MKSSDSPDIDGIYRETLRFADSLWFCVLVQAQCVNSLPHI